MRKWVFGVFALVVPALHANVINFDDLSGNTVVTTQYSALDAVFSSVSGFVNYITDQPQYEGTPPNFLCTGPVNGSIDCAEDTYVTFATPVNGLTFQAIGINNISPNVAQVDVYTNGSFDSTVIISGNDQDLAPELIDLSSFTNVSEIHIYDITDGGGIGWDTFTFTPVGSSSTPEPATYGIVAGALAIFAAVRRFRTSQ